MKALINCSNLKIGGGLQVAHSFINELSKNNEDNFTIVCSTQLLKQIKIELFSEKFKFVEYNMSISVFGLFTGKNKTLDTLVKKNNIQIVFSIFGPAYWKPMVKHFCGYAKPQYVYKDSPFFETLNFKSRANLKFKEFLHMWDFKNNNDVIITENPNVTERLSKILKGKEIHTVTNYYNQVFDFIKPSSIQKIQKLNGIKLLTIAANYPHKNLRIIPSVIDYLKEKYPDFDFNFILTIEKSELQLTKVQSKYVLFMGKVKIVDCPSLYYNSDFLFLPTLLECFSASYCEAMKMSKPILTSNLNFAKGICTDAAEYFDPVSAKSIGDSIYNLVSDLEKQKKIIKNGNERLQSFDNAEERAKKYLQIIKK